MSFLLCVVISEQFSNSLGLTLHFICTAEAGRKQHITIFHHWFQMTV